MSNFDLEKEIKAFGDKYRVKENKIVFDRKRGTWFFEDLSFSDQDEKTLINLRTMWLGWLGCTEEKQAGDTRSFINSDRNIELPVNELIQVPTKPEMACLCSMATTYRHDFGLIEDEIQRDMILNEMEKLYYEATGQGYFKRNK